MIDTTMCVFINYSAWKPSSKNSSHVTPDRTRTNTRKISVSETIINPAEYFCSVCLTQALTHNFTKR